MPPPTILQEKAGFGCHDHKSSAMPTAPGLILVTAKADAADAGWADAWRRFQPNVRTLELAKSTDLQGSGWSAQIHREIARATGPVVVVARGLACLGVAWWADLEGLNAGTVVRGVLLCEAPDLAGVMAYPTRPLMLPCCVLVSGLSGTRESRFVRKLARSWSCHFDTVPAGWMPRKRSRRHVQPLAERFFQTVMSEHNGRLCGEGGGGGYPVAPSSR